MYIHVPCSSIGAWKSAQCHGHGLVLHVRCDKLLNDGLIGVLGQVVWSVELRQRQEWTAQPLDRSSR